MSKSNFFDAFKWVVSLPSKPAGFFVPICPPAPLGNYLARIYSDPDGCHPGFSDLPVLYPGRSARFLVKGLRRVGYNARRVPFFFLLVRSAVAAFTARLKARAASKAKWK